MFKLSYLEGVMLSKVIGAKCICEFSLSLNFINYKKAHDGKRLVILPIFKK